MIINFWFNSIKDRRRGMTTTYKIYVLPELDFNNMCNNNCWNDSTVDSLPDFAFISITDKTTPQGFESSSSIFKNNHQNVLNLKINDDSNEISDEECQNIVNFIENNFGKTFYIHCNAGISRSGAIGKFIELSYDDYRNTIYNEGYLKPNISILTGLKRVLWNRRYNQGGY